MDRIGFIGLGAMGVPMAWNIQKGGFNLSVYNRTTERCAPFAEAGCKVYESPAALTGRCDVIVVMVSDDDVMTQLFCGENGILAGLTPGKIIINMTTVSVEKSLEAARMVKETGAEYIDAPVSGSLEPAAEGTLIILAGGEEKALSSVKPLLKTMGSEVVNCGKAGQGSRMKLVINLLLGNMMQSLSESMLLGKGFGLDAALILETISKTQVSAPLFQVKGTAISESDFSSHFPVRQLTKDLNLVLDAAGRMGQPLPQTAATRESFVAAMGNSLGDEDMSAIYKLLELYGGKNHH